MTCILYVMTFSCVLQQHFEAFEFIFDIMYRQCNRQPTHWTDKISITAKEDARKMANQARTKRYNENSEEWKCQRRILMHTYDCRYLTLFFTSYISSVFNCGCCRCSFPYILKYHKFHSGLMLLYCSNDKFTIYYWLRRHKILNDDLFIENFFILPLQTCIQHTWATMPIVKSVFLWHCD